MITDVSNTNKSPIEYGRGKMRKVQPIYESNKYTYDYVKDENFDTYNPYGRKEKKVKKIITQIDLEV